MALVDALRVAGHAAVISGAGPSVLVLTTRERAADISAPTDSDLDWLLLRPGVPSVGVEAVRATLGSSLGERAASRRLDS